MLANVICNCFSKILICYYVPITSIFEKIQQTIGEYFDNERGFMRFIGDVRVTPEKLKSYETQVVGIKASDYSDLLKFNKAAYECPIEKVEPFPYGSSSFGFAVGVRFELKRPEGKPDDPILIFFGTDSIRKYKTLEECKQAISKGKDVVSFSEGMLKLGVATEISNRETSSRLSKEFHEKMDQVKR